MGKTEGQKRLGKLARSHTQPVIARKCGVSQAIVSMWISGTRKPSHENRKELCFSYGIEPDAWDTPVAQQ